MQADRFSLLEFDDTPTETITTHTAEANGAKFAENGAKGTTKHAVNGITSRASGSVLSAHSLLGPADLDWDPVIVPLITSEGVTVPKQVGAAVIRSDSRAPLGIVGKRYVHLPHRTMADMADAIVGVGGGSLRFGNAGHKRDGALPYLQIASEPERIAKGIDAKIMISLFTSHDGTICYTAGFSSCVIVCQNTYAHALGNAANGIKIRHTASGAVELAQVQRIVEAAGDFAGQWSNAALRMCGESMTDDGMIRLASHLYPGESGKARVSREKLVTAWTDAPGAMPGTVFGAAQAVTWYSSHEIGSADSRETAAITGSGTGVDLQERAWWILDATPDVRAARLQTVQVYAH